MWNYTDVKSGQARGEKDLNSKTMIIVMESRYQQIPKLSNSQEQIFRHYCICVFKIQLAQLQLFQATLLQFGFEHHRSDTSLPPSFHCPKQICRFWHLGQITDSLARGTEENTVSSLLQSYPLVSAVQTHHMEHRHMSTQHAQQLPITLQRMRKPRV